MTRSWVRLFFDTARKFDSTISQRLADRHRPDPFTWDGTQIKDHLTPEDWKSLNKEISEQIDQRNDRSVAITYHAVVEDRLRWVLETRFIHDLSQSKKNWIFNGIGPLSSYVAKVEIAYALGMIPEHFRGELRLIGQIRNRFAHEFRKVRFTDPEIAKLCDRLSGFDHEGMQQEVHDDLLKRYGWHCFAAMIALFSIGQVWGRISQPSASSLEKSK